MPIRARSAGNPRPRTDGLLPLLLGAILFAGFGFALEHRSRVAMVDFKPLFYGARCMLTGHDLYSQQQLRQLYFAEGDEPPSQKLELIDNVGWAVNSPATYMLVTPLAALPWRVAHVLWMILTCTTFLLAAFLMWDLGSRSAPLICGILLSLFVIDQELLIEIGNAAGVVVALCLIAVWCFLRKRFELVGVLCLALSLAIKPHDSGLVWLYFLTAGGVFRKRALQAVLCVIVLCVPAILWVHHLGPDWMAELHQNLAAASGPGGINDPGPSGFDPRFYGSNAVSLQSAVSIFRADPHFYNPLSYFICGTALIIWFIIGVRSRFSPSLAALALAPLAALSMLPVYHRQHDTCLLMLTVPACALLWSEGQWIGKWALFITAGAAVLLSNLSLQFLAIVSAPIRAATSGLAGQMLTLLLTRPAPIVLLALVVFYLWAYSSRARILFGSARPLTALAETLAPRRNQS